MKYIAKHFMCMTLLLMVFMSFGISKLRVYDSVVSPGDEVDIFAVVRNSGVENAQDVRVFVDIPYLGSSVNGPRFTVGDENHYGRQTSWIVPDDAPPGEYVVRVTASNDDKTVRKYRRIIIV